MGDVCIHMHVEVLKNGLFQIGGVLQKWDIQKAVLHAFILYSLKKPTSINANLT